MNKTIIVYFTLFSITSFDSILYARPSDNETEVKTTAPVPNWKLHIETLENAAYADELARTRTLDELENVKGNGEAPTSNYLGLLWRIAHEPHPIKRDRLFHKLSLLTFAHYVWHAWGFKQQVSMEHQAAEKGQKTEWILRRPQEMRQKRTASRLSANGELTQIHKIMKENDHQVHEEFKAKLSLALTPIGQQLEAKRELIPTKFSDFWQILQTKDSEEFIAKLERIYDSQHTNTIDTKSDPVLEEIWNVFITVWK